MQNLLSRLSRLSRSTYKVTVRATDETGNTGEDDEFSWTVGAPPSNTGGSGVGTDR